MFVLLNCYFCVLSFLPCSFVISLSFDAVIHSFMLSFHAVVDFCLSRIDSFMTKTFVKQMVCTMLKSTFFSRWKPRGKTMTQDEPRKVSWLENAANWNLGRPRANMLHPQLGHFASLVQVEGRLFGQGHEHRGLPWDTIKHSGHGQPVRESGAHTN